MSTYYYKYYIPLLLYVSVLCSRSSTWIPIDSDTKNTTFSKILDCYTIGTSNSRWRQLPVPPPPALTITGYPRCHYLYTPEDQSEGHTVFVVIHGSCYIRPDHVSGPTNPAYFDPHCQHDQNFRNIMRFAAHYAQKHKTSVDLISFKWSGLIDETVRKVTALSLTRYLEKHYPQTPVILLSHSHGCTVANLVSQFISRPIKLMIQFAGPVRSPQLKAAKDPLEITYKLSNLYSDATPANFETLVYFYSTSDLVAACAALKKTDLLAALANTVGLGTYTLYKHATSKPPTVSSTHYIQNIRLCWGLMHQSMKNAYIHPLQEGKTIVGICTQINLQDAEHSSIVDIVKVLPTVFDMLEHDYNAHYKANSFFDLHVDLRHPQDIVHMTLRKTDTPSRTPEITSDLQVKLHQEEAFSMRQKQDFKAAYQRDLSITANNYPSIFSAFSAYYKSNKK